jgi:exonuclease III
MSINDNPTAWHRPCKNAIKVASLNCAGLKPHTMDILADTTLLKADILHLIETSLEEGENVLLSIPGYRSHFINVGNGKGIATFYKEEIFKHQQDYVERNMQITKFTSEELDVINVYRSSNGHSVELLNHLQDMITEGKPLLITGDFNICFQTISNNRMSKGLEKIGFCQLVKEATHIRGGHIDHAYWRDERDVWKSPDLQRYSPYHSDHDATCITLVKKE